MDAVEVTERMIPSGKNEEGEDSNVQGLSEEEMQSQRRRDALLADYSLESIKRRETLLDGGSSLTKRLAGNKLPRFGDEPTHRSWMMRALLGNRIGVRSEGEAFKVEPYARRGGGYVISKKLYNTDPQEALDAFYQHYEVEKEVAHFRDRWNGQIKRDAELGEEVKGIKDQISRRNRLQEKARSSDGGMSAEESAELETLEAQNLNEKLKEVRSLRYNCHSKLVAVLGKDAGNAFDYDDDFNPTDLNDYGVVLVLVKLGVLEDVSGSAKTV